MNNDELKKKIVDIVATVENCPMDIPCLGCKYDKEKRDFNAISCHDLRVVDALIKAGIGDVKDLQVQVNSLEITNIALQAGYDDAEKDRLYWVDKYKEAEHRAEVAERALRNRARKFVDLQGYPTWDIATLADEIVVPDDLKQAEKELTEEGER